MIIAEQIIRIILFEIKYRDGDDQAAIAQDGTPPGTGPHGMPAFLFKPVLHHLGNGPGNAFIIAEDVLK